MQAGPRKTVFYSSSHLCMVAVIVRTHRQHLDRTRCPRTKLFDQAVSCYIPRTLRATGLATNTRGKINHDGCANRGVYRLKRRCPIAPPGRQRADCLRSDKGRLCDAAKSTNRSFSPAIPQLIFDQVNTGSYLWKDGGLNKQTCQLVVVHVVSARFGIPRWRLHANLALQESQLLSLLVDGLSASSSVRRRRRHKLRFWTRPSPRPHK